MTDAIQQPQAPAPATIWEDLVDIFVQPAAVFRRRAGGQFAPALIILTLLTAALFLVLRNGLGPILDAEAAKASAAMLEENPQLTAEQLAQSRGMVENFAVIGVLFGTPIAVCIAGVTIWIASKLVDAKMRFAAALMIGTYAQFPRIVELLLNAVQGMLMDPAAITSRLSVSLGPARFVDSADGNPFLLSVLGSLDVITLWIVFLIGLGIHVVGFVPKKNAALGAAFAWFVSLLPAGIAALRGAAS